MHGSLESQGSSELDGPVLCRWHKEGSVKVQWYLSHFGWGGAGAGVVEDETRSKWVAWGLRLPGALVVELVD